jgi:hypothetical protein
MYKAQGVAGRALIPRQAAQAQLIEKGFVDYLLRNELTHFEGSPNAHARQEARQQEAHPLAGAAAGPLRGQSLAPLIHHEGDSGSLC